MISSWSTLYGIGLPSKDDPPPLLAPLRRSGSRELILMVAEAG